MRYPSRELADFAARQLVINGVSPNCISIKDENEPEGLNLGAGVLPRVINAIVSEHDAYPPTETRLGGFVVEVQSRGGDLNEAISRHVFGYLA